MRRNENKMILNKRDSGYIKGIAIIMMVFHHFFAFPEWQLTTGLFMGGGVFSVSL